MVDLKQSSTRLGQYRNNKVQPFNDNNNNNNDMADDKHKFIKLFEARCERKIAAMKMVDSSERLLYEMQLEEEVHQIIVEADRESNDRGTDASLTEFCVNTDQYNSSKECLQQRTDPSLTALYINETGRVLLKSVEETTSCIVYKYTESFSQYSLSQHGFSNACVIIALLTITSFYNRVMRGMETVAAFKRTIIQGNELYFTIPGVVHNPINLFATEAIDMFSLPLSAEGGLACININELINEILNGHFDGADVDNQSTFCMIVPPDKAMSVIIQDDEISIFDSHGHDGYGALIVSGKLGNIYNVLRELEELLLDSYGGLGLIGVDITQIKLSRPIL